MISSIDVQLDLDVFDAVKEAVRKSPGLMNTAFKRQARSLRGRMLPELREMPGPPSYPLRWKSQKQRRYVMAKLRREGNLPYQRTGQYAQAFEVEAVTGNRGGILSITNETPYARYVGGDDAQPMHLDTGWPQVSGIAVKYSEIATSEMIDVWWTISDPFGGVPR